MPLEVRELVVKVNVGPEPPAPARLPESELEALKRDIVDTCLAELRRRTRERDER
ncbi:MAG: hypothetical protein HYV96_12660 [Opitutae bacterium]|nr:hypothetical protein [Opitutae bacterium]